MKILFDGYWLIDGPPSGKNVLNSMLHSWQQQFPDDELIIGIPKILDVQHRNLQIEFPTMKILQISSTRVPHGIWVMFCMASRKMDVDQVISQNFSPIIRRTRAYDFKVFVHDLIFVEKPEWFTKTELMYFKLMLKSLRKQDKLFTSSKTEANRIFRFTGSPVLPTGLGVPYELARVAPVAPTLTTDFEHFILVVGRLNARKNLSRVIEAYMKIDVRKRTNFPLIVVGEKSNPTEKSETLKFDQSVHFLGHVSIDNLSWLYQKADGYICASIDEGFGLPILEATYFGCPVAASDIAVFAELFSANIHFDPLSVSQIKSSIEKLMTARDFRAKTEVTEVKVEESWHAVTKILRNEESRNWPIGY